MRLAEFIPDNKELILADWSEFAKSLGPAARALDEAELRDHAALILDGIVRDLNRPTKPGQEKENSAGHADGDDPLADSAAQAHGAGRAEDGFTLDDMVAEYRALRSSVLHRWSDACPVTSPEDFQDIMRFNESIDQSLSEALHKFTGELDASKEMFVAILGHDLRTPLSAVLMAGHYLRDSGELTESLQKASVRIVRSAGRMTEMVNNLLDFTRDRLGNGIPVQRSAADLGAIARDAIAEMTTAHPNSMFELTIVGDVRGDFDAARISQVLTNLLGNAVQHGAPSLPITVAVADKGDTITLRIRNSGPSIPSEQMSELFSPFKRLRANAGADQNTQNMGLGLYVAERVVTAHGGTIAVQSSDVSGTEFVVSLPRSPRPSTAAMPSADIGRASK